MAYTLEQIHEDETLRASLRNTTVRIWSGEHKAYWRPGASGYCKTHFEAGVFPFADALKRAGHCGAEKKIVFEPVRDKDPIPVFNEPIQGAHGCHGE